MSKRRGKPRTLRGGLDSARPERKVPKADGDWYFRPITGASSTKPYRCPGCEQIIAVATPHTVVWPVQKSLLSASALDERRHWHSACWRRKG